MKIKTIQCVFCLAAIASIIGCKDDYPLSGEQYEQFVYLSRAADEVKDEYVDYSYEYDTIYVSVSVSGSENTQSDINVFFKEDNSAISEYNRRNLSASDVQYRHLPTDAYVYPETQAVIKKGEATGVFPIYVYPEKLHCDSLYMIPIGIESVSAYEMKTEQDTVLLARINLKNKYSGRHFMDGNRTDLETNTLVTNQVYRQVVPINKNTVRLYHEVNETKGNLSAHTLTITVNESDNSLLFGSWDSFDLVDGGGVYRPEMKMFDLWYEYSNDGTNYRVEGYLYMEPDTEVGKEFIEDWIEEQKLINN